MHSHVPRQRWLAGAAAAASMSAAVLLFVSAIHQADGMPVIEASECVLNTQTCAGETPLGRPGCRTDFIPDPPFNDPQGWCTGGSGRSCQTCDGGPITQSGICVPYYTDHPEQFLTCVNINDTVACGRAQQTSCAWTAGEGCGCPSGGVDQGACSFQKCEHNYDNQGVQS